MDTHKIDINNIPHVRDLVRSGIENNNPGVSQRELAIRCQYQENGVSMLSMVKSGKAKMRLSKLGVFSDVLQINPTLLLLSALKEKLGAEHGAWEAVKTAFNTTVSENEKPFVQVLRNVQAETKKPLVLTPAAEKKLAQFLKDEIFI